MKNVAHFLASFALMVAGSSATADTLSFAALSDAGVFDTGADGTFDSIDSGDVVLSIRNFSTLPPASAFQERGVAEFSLSSLPTGSTLTGASFRFDERGFANSNTRVDIFGYQGNGVAELADATRPGSLLGSYDPVASGLGLHSVTLDLPAFATLLASSASIGLRFQGIESTNTQITSIEGARLFNTIAPTLVIDFAPGAAVPEPTTALLLGIGLVVGAPLSLRRARRIVD